MIDSEAEVSAEVLLEYEKLLKKSYTENYDELFKTDLLKVLGKDGYGYNIVMLIPCFIAATEIDPEKILRYAIMRMDPVVRENYVLILCETHTGWLMDTLYMYAKQWYDVLPRMYKKNLKKLYIIHSSFLSKTILTVLSPLLSANFWKKVEYIEKLEDIFLKLNVNPTYYLKHFPYIVQRNEEVLLGVEPISFFGADLEVLCQRFGKPYMEFKNIPSLLVNFLDHLTKPEIMNTKDLFSLQTDANTLYGIIGDIEYGEPTTDFDNIPALVCSFKLFLDVQKHGLLGKDAFARLLELKNRNKTKVLKVTLRNLYNKLERGTQQCVLCLLKFFKRASLQSNQNNMTPEAISKTFSSTFFRPRKPYVNFQECIPFANKCLMLLIENPDILTSKDVSDDDDSEVIDESNSSATEGSRGKSSKLNTNNLYSDGKVKKNSRGGSGTSSGSSTSSSSSSNSSSDKSSESSSDSGSSSSKSNLKNVKTNGMPPKTSKATEYSKAPVKVKSNSDVDDSDDSDESDDSERKGKKKEDSDDDEDDSEESATTSVSDTDTNKNTKNHKDAGSKEDKESVTSASSKSKTTNSSSASSGSNESSEEESEVESKKDAPQKTETNKTPENTDSDEDSTSETDLTSNKMKKMNTKKFPSAKENSKTEKKESTDESTNEKRETAETSEDDSDAGRNASRVSRAAVVTSVTSAATSSVSEYSEKDTLKNANKKKRNMPGKLKMNLSNNSENSGTTGKDQSQELDSGSKSTSEYGTSSSSSSQSDSDSDDE